jgi:hypothetical protein
MVIKTASFLMAGNALALFLHLLNMLIFSEITLATVADLSLVRFVSLEELQ